MHHIGIVGALHLFALTLVLLLHLVAVPYFVPPPHAVHYHANRSKSYNDCSHRYSGNQSYVAAVFTGLFCADGVVNGTGLQDGAQSCVGHHLAVGSRTDVAADGACKDAQRRVGVVDHTAVGQGYSAAGRRGDNRGDYC